MTRQCLSLKTQRIDTARKVFLFPVCLPESMEIVMGREKDRMMEIEDGQYAAAKRDDRTCSYCGNVVPYGTEFGPHGQCPACVGALKDDD